MPNTSHIYNYIQTIYKHLSMWYMCERLYEINKYYVHCNKKIFTRIIRIMQCIYYITDLYSDLKIKNNLYYNHVIYNENTFLRKGIMI